VLGSIGLLAGSGDATTLAAHVVTLLENPEKRRDFGERGRRAVLARYGLNRLVNDIHTLYEELLNR
jgi:glycosyltransferase involved in cell wall biosynthesis